MNDNRPMARFLNQRGASVLIEEDERTRIRHRIDRLC